MTKKSTVKKPTLEKWDKGDATKMTHFQVKVKKIELFWLQAWAAERGRSLSDLSREGLSILRKLPDNLLELAFLESLKRRVLSSELIENAIRKELGLPARRLQKTDKAEMETPINKQIKELRATMLTRKKPVKKSRNAQLILDAGKILDSKAYIEKIIKKKIQAGDK